MRFGQGTFLVLSLVTWKMKAVIPCLPHELTQSLNRGVPGGIVLGLGYSWDRQTWFLLSQRVWYVEYSRVWKVEMRVLYKL